MGRIIHADLHGRQLVDWNTEDTEAARRSVAEAEHILAEARVSGCAIAKKVNGDLIEVLDRDPFDPDAEEYQIFDPLIGK